MDGRVTPPKRVISPTWGPPPPCKQALSIKFKMTGILLRTVKLKNAYKNMKQKNLAGFMTIALYYHPQAANRQFSSSPGPLYQTEAFDMEMIFHKKGFARGLIFKGFWNSEVT